MIFQHNRAKSSKKVNQLMRVLLIGSGAVGLSLASALYKSNVNVDIIARNETAEAIRKNGIERCGILGDVRVIPDKIRIFETIESADSGYNFIINSAKTTGNKDIAKGLENRRADILSSDGLMVLFQNGYGNEQAFLEAFDECRIYSASLAIGFRRPKPYISEVTVITSPVEIGSIFAAPSNACEKLAEAINSGGIPAGVTGEIDKILWKKLLYNCALNPLSAILRISYGGLVESESSKNLMENIIDEIFVVMLASGHKSFWEDSQSYKKDFFETILPPTYGHRSSTLQDIERRIPTEIDSLNGAVVRLGEKYHIETPCNSVITQIIKSLECHYGAK
jgi:2-dehydropantoate 2-reductase